MNYCRESSVGYWEKYVSYSVWMHCSVAICYITGVKTSFKAGVFYLIILWNSLAHHWE